MFSSLPECLHEPMAAWWLNSNWPLIRPEKKLEVLGRFGVSADNVSTMHNALDHLVEEIGAVEILKVFIREC